MTVWERIWFTPRSGFDLAVTRLIVFWVAGFELWEHVIEDFPAGLAALGTAWDPISFVDLLGLPAPSAAVGGILWPLGAALCLLAGLGVGGRWVGVPAGLLSVYLFTLRNCFGKIDHDLNVVVMGLLVLVFAPPVASLVARLRDGDNEEPSWRFNWPVVAVRAGYALMFFGAAWSKVTNAGLDWITSESMRNILISENLLFRSPALTDVALWLAATPILWQGVAAMTIVGEGSLVLAVISSRPWVRNAAALLAVALQAGLNLLLRLGGAPLMTMVSVFADWEWLATRGRLTRLLIPGIFVGLAVINYVARPTILEALAPGAIAVVVGALALRFKSPDQGARLRRRRPPPIPTSPGAAPSWPATERRP